MDIYGLNIDVIGAIREAKITILGRADCNFLFKMNLEAEPQRPFLFAPMTEYGVVQKKIEPLTICRES